MYGDDQVHAARSVPLCIRSIKAKREPADCLVVVVPRCKKQTKGSNRLEVPSLEVSFVHEPEVENAPALSWLASVDVRSSWVGGSADTRVAGAEVGVERCSL